MTRLKGDTMSRQTITIVYVLLAVCLAVVVSLPVQSTMDGVAIGQSPDNVVLAQTSSPDEPKLIVKQNDFVRDKHPNATAKLRLPGESLKAVANLPHISGVNDRKDLEFDRQAKQLAMRLRTVNPDQQAQLRQELEALNDSHFEYRQQQRKHEIERLSARVDALRLSQLRRQQNKTEVLKRRMTELTDPNADLSWSDDEIPPDTPSGETQPNAQAVNGAKRAENTGVILPAQPTYQGKSYDEWLSILETERSPEKLGEAVDALKHLADVGDPHHLIQAIFRMNRLRNTNVHEKGIGPNYAFMTIFKSVSLLLDMPPKDVVEELIAELEEPNLPGRGIQVLSKYLIRTCLQFQEPSSPRNFPDSYRDQVSALGAEIVRRSRRILKPLANLGGRNELLDDWVIECTHNILKLNSQPLAVFPDLIPVAERVLTDPRFREKASAADLLGQSGLQAAEVLAFSENELNKLSFSGNYDLELKRICRRVAGLYPIAPDGVVSIFDHQWDAYEKPPSGWHRGQVVAIIEHLLVAIGEVGRPATGIVPYLRTKSESLECPKEIIQKISAAIDAIETAKPKPEPPPLPEDDELASTEAEVTRSASTSIPNDSSTKSSSATTSVPATVEEQTFDGVPYSKWLRMLETERKPEKLAMAFEACGRLANPQDEHRIIRRIFLGVALFEESGPALDQAEQLALIKVRATGEAALRRMSAPAVIEELAKALEDKKNFPKGHLFQVEFMSRHLTDPMKEIVKNRSDEVMRDLIGLVEVNGKDADIILAAASNVWKYSERPLNDFESLKQLSIKLMDEGTIVPPPLRKMQQFGMGGGMGPGGGMLGGIGMGGANQIANDPKPIINFFAWNTVASNLVQLAPETPRLAILFAKHCKGLSAINILPLLSRLGKHAEPAVPELVNLFVDWWRVRDDFHVGANAWQTCVSIVSTIGDIGTGEKGYELLRELRLMTIPGNYQNNNEPSLFGNVDKGLKRFPPVQEPEKPILFAHDRNMIQGSWKIQSASELPTIKGQAYFRNSQVIFDVSKRGRSRGAERGAAPAPVRTLLTQETNWHSFEIDETKTPKEITIEDNQSMPHRGIYELTESTLRIQIAGVDTERPTELVKEKSALANDQVLWEFERKIPIDTKK